MQTARVRLTKAQIKMMRLYLGLTQADFARFCGVKRLTVTRWETGKNDPGFKAEQKLLYIWRVNFKGEEFNLEG